MDDEIIRRFVFSTTEYDIANFPKTIELLVHGSRGKYRFMLAVMENYLNSLNMIPKNKAEFDVYVKELTGQPVEKLKYQMHPNSLENLAKSRKRVKKSIPRSSKSEENIGFTRSSSTEEKPSKAATSIGNNDFTKVGDSNSNLGDISKVLGIDLSGFGL